LDKKTEEKLVKRAQKNPEAFDKLFDEYYDKILRYVIYRTGNAEVARDITSEVFYKAYKNLWRFRIGMAKFSSWIYKIAGNEIIDYFRKNRYEPASLDEIMEKNGIVKFGARDDLQGEVSRLQEKIEENLVLRKISREMKNLPSKYQEAVALRFLEEKSIEEISKITGKKQGTIKSLISRGISMLRESMQPNSGPNVSVGRSAKKETR